MRARISVVLITKNAETSLEKCLDSVGFADEIVLVDSGSTDRTLAIASTYKAKVIHQDWLGFGPQKQLAVEAASHDWVLCLDADEWLSPDLINEIKAMLDNPQAKAFQFPRCNRFMGRFLKHGEGYPDWSLRLFHRGHARWSDDLVHEYVISNGPVHKLRHELMHESGEDIALYLNKQNRYTSLQAERLFQRGKRVGIAKLILSPLLRFIKFYFFRRGFLDGVPGLVHISIGCFNSYIKYAKLIELRRLKSK
ncbi:MULTISPECIES: glycosyltransferase family 2 protein [Chromobacterium]|uniref:glycosyltransferase family 2 protein n=1 Tax=Chromobacterium TaxID=535 RepID=UPI0018891C34|nr:glycosyltransferase family 2 protein [Chromobacterium haemolyticum]QOZ82145.1 glycosyltransferase family 2 protein [Chromobacterium sp. Rain0013]WON82161.1 glycosyltransferase family 2 protein [Chromobacterium haemolyticum]